MPKKYHIPPIKLFDTTEKLLRYCVKEYSCTYKEICEHYDKYLKNPKTATYRKTKYWRVKKRDSYKDVVALSGNPILISVGTLKRYNRFDYEIAFILLHEIGHILLKNDTEFRCDKFAARWMRKFVKENLIKYDK